MEMMNQDRTDFRLFGIRMVKDLETQKNNLKFILSFTLAPFVPFYTLLRTGWDFILIRYVFLVIFYYAFFVKLMVSIIGSQGISTNNSIVYSLVKSMLPVCLFFSLLFIVLCVCECFFQRRLSWNRCSWKNYDSFQHSESQWNKAGIIFFGLYILCVLAGFIFYMLI